MIQELGNGRFKVTVDRPGGDGRRIRICRTVDTRPQADALEQQLRARPTDADGRTVLDAVERYLAMHLRRFAPQTQLVYRSTADLYVRDGWIGAVRLDRLTEGTLERYYTQMIDGLYREGGRKLSTPTVKRAAALIRASLNDVRRDGWVRADQYRDARVLGPKPRRRTDESYDLADLAKVIDAGGLEVAELAQLAIASGARQGELAGLRWRDVDLMTGVVTIAGSVSRTALKGAKGQTRHVRKDTKSGRPRRVRVDDACIAMLTDRYARQLKQAAEAGVDDELGDRAVLSVELELDYVAPKALYHRWATAAKAAGVAMRFHDLRHVSASEMLAGGVSIVDASRRGGWSSSQTMLESYAHARADVDDLARGTLERAWQRVEAHRSPDESSEA